MNLKKINAIVARIKTDILILESELGTFESDEKGLDKSLEKSIPHIRYSVEYKGKLLSEGKRLSQRKVFALIVSNEIKYRTIDELKSIFGKSKFPKTGNFYSNSYIITENELESVAPSYVQRYTELSQKSLDNKSVLVFNQWAQSANKKTKSPGNFPVLVKIAKTLGYTISEV